MARPLPAPGDEVVMRLVSMELEGTTAEALKALFPGVPLEDAIIAIIEDVLAEADEINGRTNR